MDSAREARDVRREEAPEARLGGLLPGIRLTQCSHREELVEPGPNKATHVHSANTFTENIISSFSEGKRTPDGDCVALLCHWL